VGWLALGLVLGLFLGVVLMALLQAAGAAGRLEEEAVRARARSMAEDPGQRGSP